MNPIDRETLRQTYERCDVSNNGTVNPMSFDEFCEFVATVRAEAEANLLSGLLTINFKSVLDQRDWLAKQLENIEAALPKQDKQS